METWAQNDQLTSATGAVRAVTSREAEVKERAAWWSKRPTHTARDGWIQGERVESSSARQPELPPLKKSADAAGKGQLGGQANTRGSYEIASRAFERHDPPLSITCTTPGCGSSRRISKPKGVGDSLLVQELCGTCGRLQSGNNLLYAQRLRPLNQLLRKKGELLRKELLKKVNKTGVEGAEPPPGVEGAEPPSTSCLFLLNPNVFL